jgi:hypothetical protein
VNDLLAKHGINVHVIKYVKDERGEFFHHDFYFNFVLSCEVLGLFTPFVGTCWGHAMFKCCQYVANDSNVCVGLTSIFKQKINFAKNHHLDQ